MPSGRVTGKIIAAIICSICAVHSTDALSVDTPNGPWTNLYGCAKEDMTSMIGEASVLFCVHHQGNRKMRSKPGRHALR